MGFNITSWGQNGRNFGRGDAPPKGSIEYIAVGSMWTPDPPSKESMNMGADAKTVTYSDVDAADRWLANLHRSLAYSRQIHGDRFVGKLELEMWDAFIGRWNPFRNSLGTLTILWMSTDNKRTFHNLLGEANKLQKHFDAKGVVAIPVPYALELVTLLRTMPKKMAVPEMLSKLAAGIQCGDKLLDADAPWYDWRKSGDAKGLAMAVDAAKAMAIILTRSKESRSSYSPGDPVYDEFLRRLTRIWIEAAGLYGVREAERSNLADLKSDLKKGAEGTPSNIAWLLLSAGVGYLGLRWVAGRVGIGGSGNTVVVAVPDAIVDDERQP